MITGRSHEVLRLETLAESVLTEMLRDRTAAAEFPGRFDAPPDDVGPEVVAFKSILAYRFGFDVAAELPSSDDVVTAAGRWQRTVAARLTDPVLLRFLIWTALYRKPLRGRRRPLQLHTRFGDTDPNLHRANPILLTGLIREEQRRDSAPIVLLHCYPYHREAAYLAAVYPNVHLDIGLGVSHLGPSAGSWCERRWSWRRSANCTTPRTPPVSPSSPDRGDGVAPGTYVLEDGAIRFETVAFTVEPA